MYPIVTPAQFAGSSQAGAGRRGPMLPETQPRKRRKIAAHGASRGVARAKRQAPKGRKKRLTFRPNFEGLDLVVFVRSETRNRPLTALTALALIFAATGLTLTAIPAAGQSSDSSRKTASKRHHKKAAKVRGQQKMDPERVQEIQEALIREHYLNGDATGIWAPCQRRRHAPLPGRQRMAKQIRSRLPRHHQTRPRPKQRSPAESRKRHDHGARSAPIGIKRAHLQHSPGSSKPHSPRHQSSRHGIFQPAVKAAVGN